MTKINFKNKTKTATTIISALVIGLVLLSPTTIIPQVSAQTSHFGLPSIKLSSDVSNQVIQMQQYVSNQIHLHPTWIGLFSGNSSGVTIQYLGPADKNPYYLGNIVGTSKGSGAQLRLSPTNNPTAQAGPASYGSSSYTTAYEIQQDFHNISSSNSNVDFIQVLNALNVDSTHWMQSGFTDDVNNLTGKGVGYYAVYDSYHVNSGEDGGFPVYDSITVSSATDLIVQNDYANGDGTYTMYTTDNANGHFTGLIVGYSDSGANMKLGHVTENSGFVDISGSMSEEESKTSTTWSWGTQTYYLAYWNCSGCTELTTTNNPWTTGQSGGVSFSESNSPNAYDSMTY